MFSRRDTKVIKGIAIILMLYHHLFFLPERLAPEIVYLPVITLKGQSLAYYIGEFGKICVALFLFLGGYGTWISCRKGSESDTCMSGIISRKIAGLYREYWKVFLVFVPLCMFANVEQVPKDAGRLVWNFTGLSTSYCDEWWFFTPYVALLATFPVAYRLLSRQKEIYTDFFGLLLFDVAVWYVLPSIHTYAWAGYLQNSLFWEILETMLNNAPTFYVGCLFAKHDLLAKWKQRWLSGRFALLSAGMGMMVVIYMRHTTWAIYDFVYAPLFTISAIVFVEKLPLHFVYTLLMKIGEESTVIWLVHSIYCYMLCQKLVFLPKYTLLIFLWLLCMSYVTSHALKKASQAVHKVAEKLCQKPAAV